MLTITSTPKTFMVLTGKDKKAESTVDLSGGKTLRIQTSKRMNGTLCTTATVGVSEKGDGYSTFRYTVYQDYSGVILMEECRVTAKRIESQHIESLKHLDRVMECVNNHYGE